MNLRSTNKIGKWIAFIAVICMASCKKDASSTNTNQSNATILSDSSATADKMYYDVLNTALVGVTDNSSVMSTSSLHEGRTTTLSTETTGTTNLGCAIYTIDDTIPGQYPKTLTLDFGTGCTSADGILRKGKISYLFSGSILSAGTTVSVTFTNYVVNGYGLQGVYTMTNNSTQTGFSFATQVTNGIITYPNATSYHYSHNRTYALTSGLSTPLIFSDDVYSITGNSSFSNMNGDSLVCNIATPLVKAVSCPNVSAGVISFVYDQVVNGSLDFGDGTCDNLATLTVGTVEQTITLR